MSVGAAGERPRHDDDSPPDPDRQDPGGRARGGSARSRVRPRGVGGDADLRRHAPLPCAARPAADRARPAGGGRVPDRAGAAAPGATRDVRAVHRRRRARPRLRACPGAGLPASRRRGRRRAAQRRVAMVPDLPRRVAAGRPGHAVRRDRSPLHRPVGGRRPGDQGIAPRARGDGRRRRLRHGRGGRRGRDGPGRPIERRPSVAAGRGRAPGRERRATRARGGAASCWRWPSPRGGTRPWAA